MTNLDLCLEVVKNHVNHYATFATECSQKQLVIEAWFQRTTNINWPMENQMMTSSMTSR